LIDLKDVSLVAVATQDVEETVQAIEYSLKGMSFEKVQLFAHYNPQPDSKDYEFIKIDTFSSVGEWGKFIIFELYKFITTKHIILIHADGFIVNPESWNNEFLKYDYIGAPWQLPKDNFSFRDYYGNIIRQGNSVSLRSYNILKLPSEKNIKWKADHDFFHEDGFLCVLSRHLLIKEGIEFAPLSVACKFSHEKPIPELKGVKPFLFHKWEGNNKDYPKFGRYNVDLFTRTMNIIKKIRKKLWQK